MKPLLYIAVTLSLAWVTRGAPKPLSLINITTLSDLNDLTTVTASEADGPVEDQKHTLTKSEKKESSTVSDSSDKVISVTDFESTLDSAEAREENDQATTFVGGMKEEIFSTASPDELSSDSKIIVADKTEVIDPITIESPDIKSTEKGEENSKSEIPISRYVPPLDPMKHMLLMADIKNAPKATSHLEKVNTSPTTTIIDVTVSPDTSPDIEAVSSESSEIIEKVVAESSEVEEKHEPMVTETTVSDILSTEVILKSEDLGSEKETQTETPSVASSTEILPMTISSLKETTIDATEKPGEVEETLAILKNSEEILKTNNDETVETEKEPENIPENETTAAVFTTTEEAMKVSEETVNVEDLTSAENLLKNAEEMKSETTSVGSETTTYKSVFTTVNDIDMKKSDSSTIENKDDISTTSTTVVPETTFESSSALSIENEKRTIYLEDELEFRAVKIPIFNESKVSYVERKPIVTRDPEIAEVSSPVSDDTESTTASILTTIAEMLFSSSSTTESSEGPITEADEEPTSEESSESTVLPLSVDKEELLDIVDSGAILTNDPADMLKVQPIKTGLDSVPAKETSTDISLISTTVTEIQHEALVNDQSVKIPEPDLEEKHIETTSESLPETAEVYFSTTQEDTSSENPTTIAATTFSESIAEDANEKDVEKDEAENNLPEEEKPSDYFLNAKDRYVSGDNKDMVAAVQFLHYHDKASSEQCFKLVDAHWNYATNLTEENKKKQLEQTLEYSLFHKDAWKNATSFAWKSFNDTLLRRWFKSLSVLGTAALPEEKLNEFNRLKAEMKNTYSTAKVCVYVPPEVAKKGKIITEKDCNLTLEPDLQRTLTKSRDYDELVHVWKSWRNAAGKPIRDKYLRFVNLSNEAARLNGFSDTGDMWREAYESETFETALEQLWEQLKPLYEHLHAYVRRRLIQQYGSENIKTDGPIPAHLFGNMWAQSWVSLLDIMQPFPGKPSVDVTPIMEAKNMSAYEMFKISEEFFTSLGLKAMPEPFWKHSLIEKPKDREIICHASAWDFCNGRDYRIKQCTDITMEDLITVHHEMGHIQYFLQYARQPNVFREGANPGFHEAIGDVLALSASTPKHLQSIGLLDEVADDPEGDLNFLLYTALDKVSFLPSGYLIDLWRWGLFSGEIKPEEMNTKWWELRLKYQGVCPPVKRTDTDFDPGAKFHVPGNVPYIRYFVSFVIQFQFHKVLCDSAGHTGPLYKCDIYRSKEAGQILSQVMELGSSEHWSEAMKIMTGGATNKMDAGPILEYFEPLLEFLKEQNKHETLGWQSDDATVCP